MKYVNMFGEWFENSAVALFLGMLFGMWILIERIS
jgi:hypothetical protein